MVEQELGIRARGALGLLRLLPSGAVEATNMDAWRSAVVSNQRVNAWVEMLETHTWELYCHLTFSQHVSDATADRQFKKWINGLNRVVFGSRYTSDKNRKDSDGGLYWVRSTERQKRGALHLHAVIGNPSDRKQLIPELCEVRWNKLAGDAKIDYFNPDLAGLAYAVKSARNDSYNIDVSDNLKSALPTTAGDADHAHV